MTRTPLRLGVGVALAIAAGVTVFAQRGGGFRFGMSYAENTRYDGKFVFIRMSYPSTGFRQPRWSHDYPDGEVHFMKILTAVSNVPAHVEDTNIMGFGDPEVFKFPLIYLCEPGDWTMTDEEVKGLRGYLEKGGFMIVDDFPQWAWGNFDLQMSRVFPEYRWLDLDVTHPIWHSFFEISNLDNPPPYPQLGPRAIYRALFKDNDPTKQMFVVANFQNDLSEYWEFSERGRYAVDQSNESYKLGVNEFVYGITH